MYQPRRRIERRNAKGDLIGTFETTLSDAELAEQDRRTAERREALLASVSVIRRSAAASRSSGGPQ